MDLRRAGMRIAPQVLASLDEHAAGDRQAVAELVALFSSAQLAGYSMLPDPLPTVPRVRAMLTVFDALSGIERRVLLMAALSVSDRVSAVLVAAAVDADVFLRDPITRIVAIEDGGFRFVVPGARSILLNEASNHEVRQAQAALARSLRRSGPTLLAAWHAFLADGRDPAADYSDLLILAKMQLDRGAAGAAQLVAAAVARSAAGAVRSRALALASHAALLGGYVEDADRYLTAAMARSTGRADRELRAAIEIHREGAGDHRDGRSRWLSQMLALQPVLTAAGDRAAFSEMVAGSEYWWSAPHEADELMARTALSASRSRHGWALTARSEPTTPLGEAYIRLMETAFQIQAGEYHVAGATLRDAMPRLPLVVPGGGVGSLIRMLRQHGVAFDEELVEVYDSIAPSNRIDHVVVGPPTGGRTSAVSRLRVGASDFLADPGVAGHMPLITRRENDVIALLLEGLSNKQIGERLKISARTVEVHLGKIYRKTGTSSRHELMVRKFRGDVQEA